MGDPVTMAIVAGGSMATQAYLGGKQQRSQAKIQAAQLSTEEKAIQTNAAVEQAERMNKLKAILAAQNAAFAMSGQTAGVGTASAIQAGSISNAAREQRLANLQTDIATSGLDYSIWSAKKTAKLALGNQFLMTGLNAASRIGEAYVTNSFSAGGNKTTDGKEAGGKK